jgi:putative hemolysin
MQNYAVELPPSSKPRRYVSGFATQKKDILQALRLRYRVFSGELGADLEGPEPGIDRDVIDEYCDHLVVRDATSGQIVACTRLLSDTQARRLGYYYSENEFHLKGVLTLPGRFLEIGRTCVDPNHRGSLVLGTLWGGLAEYVSTHQFDYLMGCASIPPGPNGFSVEAVYRQILPHQLGPEHLDVRPKIEVPLHKQSIRDEYGLPPLLQAYLRLGCWVLGEPYWDANFNVMDVFILLELNRMQARYEKRFISGRYEGNNHRMASSHGQAHPHSDDDSFWPHSGHADHSNSRMVGTHCSAKSP